MSMTLFENNGAEFSPDRKHRYCLWRIWDESKPLVMFIGLNPSTANEQDSDKTITRVKNFATDWGYGGVYMMNCFTFVTAYPEEIEINWDSIGINIDRIKSIGSKCGEVIFAWGNFKIVKDEAIDRILKDAFPSAKALVLNKNGSPRHPLYVPGNTIPIKFLG